MTFHSRPASLAAFYDGWANHEERLLEVIRPLTAEQLQLRQAPDHWAVWQLASNMVGGRAYWFCHILLEGDSEVREMFRAASTTVPDLPLADAGWEDDETHPRSASELADAFAATRRMVEDCLERWTEEDLLKEFSRKRGEKSVTFTRSWVIWHLMEHELQHGTEIAIILRSHGLRTLDL